MRTKPLEFSEVMGTWRTAMQINRYDQIFDFLDNVSTIRVNYLQSDSWEEIREEDLIKVMAEAGKSYLQECRFNLLNKLNKDLGFLE